MTTSLVISLDDPRATERDVVGGKAASLARLVAADFPVPAGVCVTTTAYRRIADTDAVDAAIARLTDRESVAGDADTAPDPGDNADADTDRDADQGAGGAGAVRDAIRDRPLPAELRDQVAAAVAELDGDRFAVRSSATAEDLPTASFAGQHETFLGVAAADVPARVRDCMASLFTDRAVAYRERNGVPHDDVALAVVVQPMVSPAVAGVLFTADPRTGNRRVASVEASYGLAEAVVSGEVTADNARVDRDTGEILDYDVGDKAIEVQHDADATSGTTTLDVPPDRRADRALTDDQLRALVALGDRIEALFDAPQDVEWALVDDAFVVLQSRPITSLFPLPEPAPTADDDRLHVYLSFGHAQAMPEALPPLVVDRWRAFLNDGFAAASERARDGRFAVAAGGRIYLDLTPLLQFGPLRDRLPDRLAVANEPAAAGLRDLLDRRGDELPAATAPAAARTLARFLRRAGPAIAPYLPWVARRYAAAFAVGPPAPERELSWVEAWGRRLATSIRDPDRADATDSAGAAGTVAPTATGDASARARAAFGQHDFSTVLSGVVPRIGPLLLAAVTARKALERLVPDAPPGRPGDVDAQRDIDAQRVGDVDADLDAIGTGLEHELVTTLNQRLGDLADTARETPAVAEAIREEPSVAALDGVEGADAFLDELDAFLDAFGHRATGEIDVSRPRWRDDPAGLLQAVRGTLLGDDAGMHRAHLADLQREAAAATDRIERRAARGPLGPLRARLVRRLVRTHRGGLQLREYPKQGIGHLFAAWHDALADAGTALAADGRLDDPDDVWFLRRDELRRALESDAAPVPADEIAARRREHERYAAMTAPPLMTSDGADPTALRSRDVPAGTLVGTPVSAGVVEGTVRVVRDPATTDVAPGDVIVAPSCDPGWTPLFLNAAGLVTEVGGRMTHGALVAREYGLPAVVSVRNATTELRTGDRVRVDGTQGTIERLDADAETTE